MAKPLPKLPTRSHQATRLSTATTMFGDLANDGRLRTIAIDSITPNPRQPRRRFDEAALDGLAASITARGVLQPPVARERPNGQHELIAGERRWRAAIRAGLTTIEVLIKDDDDAGSLEDALVENVVREDLSPIEKARAYGTIIEDLGLTREGLGHRLGQSRVSISNHLRLLDLPDPALELIDDGTLTFAHGRALLLCDDHNTRSHLARQAASQGWSTRELEDAARNAGAPRARRPKHRRNPEHQAIARQLADATSKATGIDIRIRATGNNTYTFTIHGHDAARVLAQQLGAEVLDESI